MKAKNIKIINFIVAVLVALFAIGQAFAWLATGSVYLRQGFGGSSAGAYFAYGDGSEAHPFGINTKYHMYNLAWLQNTGRLVRADDEGNVVPQKYYFELDPDMEETLNMGDMWLPPIGNDENPFMGEFNGNGKSLANLRITTDKSKLTANPASENYEFSNAVGMFGMTAEDSEVANFILTNPIVEAAATDTKYADISTSNQVIGLAIGHVAGKCYSIGVRATETGAQSTTLDVLKKGYSTFNSILGELAEGVESSVTGGGHTGSGGSGNAFGASFDVDGMYDRLVKIEANKKSTTPAWRLPNLGDSSKESITIGTLEKLPFTVDASLSTYVGADAKEVLATNNIGYLLGSQNKVYAKTVKFGDPIKNVTNGNYQYEDGTYPNTNKVIPRWFYKTNITYIGDDNYSNSNMRALTDSEFAALPQGIKDLLPASNGQVEGYGSIRISQSYSNVGSQIYPGTASGNQWSPHGQISWMGNTYGLGFTKTDYKGNAIDENGNLYAADGNLIGEDGYEVDDYGVYSVDPASYPDFPYVVTKVGTAWPDDGVAFDDNGNRYYRYDPAKSGLYVYGVLKNGYLMTGDGYQYYVAPIAGWDQPIALIDADGYAMYAAGVYFDASGNIVEGGYVKDENGLYIPADSNFVLPITQITNGHARDEDGNYYGLITVNGKSVYCYLGSDGTASGYDGWYMIDGNNFLVTATNVDASGNVKYNETDFYGTYNGQSGYVDANGYFYDDNHAYVVTDENFTYVVTDVDSDGYAMTSDGVYYGIYNNEYGYLTGDYYYTVRNGQITYVVNDNNFYGTVSNVDSDGYAMTSDGNYYGKYRQWDWQPYNYGEIEIINGTQCLKLDGKYIATDGNTYEFIDDRGHFKYDADSEFYYGKKNSWDAYFTKLNKDGCVYDESIDAKGNVKGYYLNNHWWLTNQGYSPCEDVDSDNFGYYVNAAGDAYINYFAPGTDKRLKAWGYTSDEISAILNAGKIGNSATNYRDSSEFIDIGTFIETVPGEKIKVEKGEKVSVEEGVKSKAISDADINGLEGEFITPKEIEKIKVVTETVSANDKLDKVTVKKADPVALYNFKSGVALPNNGIWFKPSIVGKIRLVMYAETAGDGFTLIQGHRTSATKEDPFIVDYSQAGNDITVKEIAKCGLPSRVLFYFEYDIGPEEIADGRYEYWILQNDGGNGKDPGGAYFVYLDLGASAPDDVGAIDKEKNVSAVDFIYDTVEIHQGEATDGILKGDFIIKSSSPLERYESSKTSVYFEDIKQILKIVFVRLYSRSDGKTIQVTVTSTAPNEVRATNEALVVGLTAG